MESYVAVLDTIGSPQSLISVARVLALDSTPNFFRATLREL